MKQGNDDDAIERARRRMSDTTPSIDAQLASSLSRLLAYVQEHNGNGCYMSDCECEGNEESKALVGEVEAVLQAWRKQ